MGNRIPDEVVNQVQQSADIVEVIGDYVQLKSKATTLGSVRFTGKTRPRFPSPAISRSFIASDAERAGTFSFLRQMEGYSFTEAVSHLADKYQIDFLMI